MALNTNVSFRNEPNEVVMNKIKRRLKIASDNVAFYADNTWTHDFFSYQKANQELYATDVRLQDSMIEESTKARTVRDIIPHSKLAQYSNYEYNEAREMSYASPVSDISFYYPCLYKKDSIKEPWMLPEVEQVFIWLTYPKQFDLSNPQSLEELACMDERSTDHPCSYSEFHEFKPMLYENVERTPGKTRYTVNNYMTRNDYPVANPHTLTVSSFEDMILKMRLRSDKVKSIWNAGNEVVYKDNERKLNVFKSPLDNYYVMEFSKQNAFDRRDNKHAPLYFNDLKDKSGDIRGIQNLLIDFNRMKSTRSISKVENTKPIVDVPKTEGAPIRRLYSDVVQGLSSNKTSPMKNQSSDLPSPSSTKTTISKETPLISPRTATSTCFSTEESLQSKIPKPSSHYARNASMAWQKISENPISGYSKPKTTPPIHNAKSENFMYSSQQRIATNENCSNLPTSSTNEYNPYDVYAYANSNFYSNSCSAVSNSFNYYCNNQHQHSQNNVYTNTYTNYSSYATPNSISVSPQTCRQNFCQNPFQFASQTHHYFFNQYRNAYNVQHFTPQPYFILTQPPPKAPQRWTPPQQCLRTNTPQNYIPSQTNQYWNVPTQNVYRTNSNQQIYNYHQQLCDNTTTNSGDSRSKFKPRKITLPNKIILNKPLDYNTNKTEILNQNKKSLSETSNKIVFIKNNSISDYKEVRREPLQIVPKLNKTTIIPNLTKDFSCPSDTDSASVIPVTESISEELERQALDEYQSSNDSFYKELEKQAVEQYEECSENLMCPPNEDIFFGGLPSRHLFSCTITIHKEIFQWYFCLNVSFDGLQS